MRPADLPADTPLSSWESPPLKFRVFLECQTWYDKTSGFVALSRATNSLVFVPGLAVGKPGNPNLGGWLCRMMWCDNDVVRVGRVEGKQTLATLSLGGYQLTLSGS